MRKLASIRTIAELKPIVGADRIELATVDAWQCVVDKNQFKVGGKCIYFEIDSVIPIAPWNDRFRKEAMLKPLRIKSRSFKKCLSQGLCFDFSILPVGDYEVGQDVTDILGVTKYEPPVPAELSGMIKGNFPSSFISKTDEERAQNVKEIIQEIRDKNLTMVGTLKCDGSSMTTGFIPYTEGRDFVVCSRNMNLSECDNTFWKMARKYFIKEKLEAYTDSYVIQCEVIGEGIQSNRMGIKGQEIRVFNVKNVTQNRHLDRDEIVAFCETNGFPVAPELFRFEFSPEITVQHLLAMADTLNYDSGHPAEGIVWRPVNEQYSDVLKGRMSFKTVSNRFLLHIGE